MINTYKNNSFSMTCRICLGKNLKRLISLGTQPLANGFLTKENLNKEEPLYPLDIYLCLGCGLVQTPEISAQRQIYMNYVYIPSTSETVRGHFDDLAENVAKKLKLPPGSLVLDIGSNDGTLLKAFKKRGYRVLGIDPAKKIADKATREGIPTLVAFFNLKKARQILRIYGQPSLITATNVVAHINKLRDFFKGIELLLNKEGVFLAEFPYLLDLVENNEFDTIYHEHLSYLSLRPLQKLFEQTQLELFRVDRIPIHGGSVRIYLSKQGRKISPSVPAQLETEKRLGLNSFGYLKRFAQRVEKLKKQLLTTLRGLKASGKKIVGAGAAAKGNTLLNYCQIGPQVLDYIVDSTPYKQGLFTPGTHIPIYPESKIEKDQPDYLLILAWNFAKEIMRKNQAFLKKGGKFIIPVSSVQIVEETKRKAKKDLPS